MGVIKTLLSNIRSRFGEKRIDMPMLTFLIAISYFYISPNFCSAQDDNYIHGHSGEDDDNLTLFNKYTGLNTTLLASIIISKDEMLESWSKSYPVSVSVTKINKFLSDSGVPNKSLLTTDEFVVAILTIMITLGMYYFVLGKNHVKKRKRLAADLKIAQEKVNRFRNSCL